MKKKVCLLFLSLFLTGYCLSCRAQSYSSLDREAQNVPLVYEQNKEALVKYLMSFTRNDAEKARILAAWIVFNVDENKFKSIREKKETNRGRAAPVISSGDTFITRIGNSEDFADLYQELGELAGLEVAVIPGYAGYNLSSRNYLQNKHTWNAVKIDGEWRLLDIAWAMKGTSFGASMKNLALYEEEVERRGDLSYSLARRLRSNKSFDNRWFFTSPYTMIKTHVPLQDSWQLLPVPKYFSFTQKDS